MRWVCTATAVSDTRVEPVNDAESSLRTAETLPSLRLADPLPDASPDESNLR
jgi:hypothetical protein